jgi:DNA-binding transcriptional regulator GbsR (MarR family)
MSTIIATLERVREACTLLQASGQTLSLSNVLGITGGSKSTVLKHLKTVRDEMAAEGSVPSGDIVFLQKLADQMLPKLWSAAQSHARHPLERRIQELMAVKAGLEEDNEALQKAEEAASARAEEAERRLEALEAELKSRNAMEEQMRALATMVEALSTKRRGRTGSDRQLVAGILAEAGAPLAREELYRRLEEKGLSNAAAQKARWHAVKAEDANDDDGLVSLKVDRAAGSEGEVAAERRRTEEVAKDTQAAITDRLRSGG